jgi:hypothetical protein
MEGAPNNNQENREGSTDEQEVTRGLEDAGEDLESLKEGVVTPELFLMLEGKVNAVVGIIAAYAGYKLVEYGTSSFTMRPEDIKEIASMAVGGTALAAGISKFLSGAYQFLKFRKKVFKDEDDQE